MKLYHHPRTRSSRVKWLLGELGIDHEVQPVDVFAGEGRKPDYQENVHKHGFVPALEDDGIVLIESSAICMYLVDRYGKGRLAPEISSKERGKYYEWMVYVPATADPVCETAMFHTVFLPEDKRVPALVDRAKKTWSQKIEPRYKQALEKSKYVLGDELSAADILVGGSLMWGRMANLLSDDPVIGRYLESLMSRPAFVTAHT